MVSAFYKDMYKDNLNKVNTGNISVALKLFKEYMLIYYGKSLIFT